MQHDVLGKKCVDLMQWQSADSLLQREGSPRNRSRVSGSSITQPAWVFGVSFAKWEAIELL